MVAQKSRAEYFRKRRESLKQFNVAIPKEKLEKFEEKLKTKNQTKTAWLTQKIDEELSK